MVMFFIVQGSERLQAEWRTLRMRGVRRPPVEGTAHGFCRQGTPGTGVGARGRDPAVRISVGKVEHAQGKREWTAKPDA